MHWKCLECLGDVPPTGDSPKRDLPFPLKPFNWLAAFVERQEIYYEVRHVQLDRDIRSGFAQIGSNCLSR